MFRQRFSEYGMKEVVQEFTVVAEGQVEAAPHGRRDGQYDQRQGHHPGRLVRRGRVFAFLSFRGGRTRLAVEHQNDLARHVVGGEQRRDHTDGPQRDVLVERREEDVVLGPETGERRDPGDGQPTDQERERGDRHVLAQAAHLLHVLLVVQAVNDRAGTEEHERLEERVRDHVEDRGDVVAGSDGEEHEAELAHR